jgi:hypothetical protein
MGDDGRDLRLARLDALVGEWRIEVPQWPLPAEIADQARTTFAWELGGGFLVQRSSVPLSRRPTG